ncbi:MAG: ribonuclease H-like domain-containing protein, partial [candidate division NC10 bacterium]|nr:ribonuclease H-like domain-containing protein [candidate division NC10 bacterium]
YFMRDYGEERALLIALRDFLSQGRGVVSYNGKMFDLPLLSDRFLLNRMRSPLEDLPHLDLLHPARRLWRERMGGCSLIHLEESLLGIRRLDDVPSELIPSLYFRYLQYPDPSLVEPVFSHNALDLLSLMALKARACSAVEDPEGCAIQHGEDYYCLGRIFEDLGQWERSIPCYECALDRGLPAHLRNEARRRLSLILKRSGDRPRAVQIWQSSITQDGSRFDPFSYEELAKHKEHQERDYEGAILIVERAIEQLRTLASSSSEMEILLGRFRYRLRRLRHKLRGERWY